MQLSWDNIYFITVKKSHLNLSLASIAGVLHCRLMADVAFFSNCFLAYQAEKGKKKHQSDSGEVESIAAFRNTGETTASHYPTNL